ncbi:Serine/threonine-protein kinase ppk6 [Lachnellula suecica]|uniref:non-specific serine/threonine protein kinase n=1 Tax=Lachnellula suecica TaxID=602035 RepID=A0A8T9C5V8_9HELO|nr:Serine/threonine-protein kinase ppk6 [Lachnellula suecica]
MLEPDGPTHHGVDTQGDTARGRKPNSPGELLIPKNRSTGNLLLHSQNGPDKARIRFSFDAGIAGSEYDTMSKSPIMTEHEHGLGASGLRRIRQQPPSRVPTIPSSASSSRNPSVGPRSSSMTLSFPNSRSASMAIASGPSSPTLNFTEDLSRFPSESLHSFSFAHQSEEFIHNRQNVLKRSVEFMSQKLGWGSTNAGIASAQARVSGDQDMQNMLDLLARAKLVGANNIPGGGQTHFSGPLTGPATAEDSGNVFDASFVPHSDSSDLFDSPHSSPLTLRKPVEPRTVPDDTMLPGESKTETESASEQESEPFSRVLTNEIRTTAPTSSLPRRQSLKRTYTDIAPLTLQNKLMDALAQPYISADTFNDQLLSPIVPQSAGPSSFGMSGPHPIGPAVHGHSSRWSPAAQAIFTTESAPPYTVLAANDLACLVFGVTKAEVRKMGILEVVREERRSWLEEKLRSPGNASGPPSGKQTPRSPDQSQSQRGSPTSTTSFLLGRSGVTASLLSRPNSRQTSKTPRRAQTDDGAGSSIVARTKAVKGGLYHPSNKSRGVLLCGDVVPIQKRNGAIGSASLWVKEKRSGLIWVLEEIHEDVSTLSLDDDAQITKITGSTGPIWGENMTRVGMDVGKLLPRLPRQGIDGRTGEIDYAEVAKRKYFTARNSARVNIPCMVERVLGGTDLRISSFPHIAGIMVLSAKTLEITSSNSVFSAALFGQEKPDGRRITDLIPDFDRILKILTDEDGVRLVDGIVIPEHSFRRARAFLAIRDGKADAAAYFLKPDGLPAKHRDGSEIKIDAQLRVVKSESNTRVFDENVIEERSDEEEDLSASRSETSTELVYALWITYSRHLHAIKQNPDAASPLLSGLQTPLHQPSPGQTEIASPIDMDSDEPKEQSHASLLTAQLKAAAKKTAARFIGREPPAPKEVKEKEPVSEIIEPVQKKTIEDFVILEEMGQGAYGQVKLARCKKNGNRKVVLKYVTKRRILVDTWTRDRKLGTVPLEIHVLNYLRRDDLKHPNIVEMSDFFEDDVNYYIEMVPHGLPGMDLFDYIELRVNMEENECRSIFVQVVKAVHHLHIKALVVHRDIKDENVVLDGEGNIKLIDFGSAAYIKNGPFDVFVGTIDYAAPEALAGKSYRGKEQDVWALGILLYTIIYKENPFYSIDEILDRDLRIPYVMSEDSIDLIRAMLDRDVASRITIEAVLAHPWCSTEDD